MSEAIRPIAEWCAAIIEFLGIGILTATAIYVLLFSAYNMIQRQNLSTIYHIIRQRLGHGILMGLEFFVAADIIHTVAVELTFQTVGVLAIIVALRTFLSFTLEVELTGKWPWQNEG